MHILARLENAHHPKERITGDLTIEHVMPQTLSDEWRKSLGGDADSINDRWGDTLGNLTLSGANGSLSNKTFQAKDMLDMNGYDASPLWLDRTLKKHSRWDQDEIRRRGELLADEAVKVWPMPGSVLI